MSEPTRLVAACVKYVDLRPEFDPITGNITESAHGGGFSEADRAASEVALRLAESAGVEAVLLTAAGPAADPALAELGATGFTRIVRADAPAALDSPTTAELLVRVLGANDLDANLVVCGDLSQDRGSGAVPATIAHHMGLCQALGLLEVEPESDSSLLATRRLDGARRERIRIPVPAVVSVEGGVAALRRAPLASALGGSSAEASVEIRRVHLASVVDPPRTHPWRPRARTYPAPHGESAFERIVDLTDSLSDSAPPRTVEAEPADAAAMIVEQLGEWGYLDLGSRTE